MKRRTGGLLNKRKQYAIFTFIIFMVSWSFAISMASSILPTETEEEARIEDKIDQRIFDALKNETYTQKTIRVIIVIKESYDVLHVNFPSYVEVLSYYTILNGLLANIPIEKVYELAKSPQIRSIWWDTPIKTDLNNHIPFETIKASISPSKNPFYDNFTEEIGVTELWKKGYNGTNVVIAVLDTGVDISGSAGGDLDDFDENTTTADPKYLGGVSMVPYEPLYYSDLNGRGTFHAGIACGTGNINKSYIGVAPGAYYLNVKIYDSIGITYWSFMIGGIEWAILHGADVLLFAATIPGLYLDPISITVNHAVERGCVVVVPVGDDGPGYMSINSPGQASKAFKVGAFNSFTGEVWENSSRGPSLDFTVGPDIIAPGVGLIGPRSRIFSEEAFDMLQGINDVASSFGYSFDYNLDIDTTQFSMAIPATSYGEEVPNEPNYTRASGTGAAAAVVAGAIAILISAFPLARPTLLTQALMETAIPTTEDHDQNTEGAGFINVSAAFDWLKTLFEPNKYEIVPLSVPLLYAGVITCADYRNVSQYSQYTDRPLLQYDLTSVFSTQAMFTTLVVTNSTEPDATNMTSIHLPLNQFGVQYSLSNNPQKTIFHWFSEFYVVREMHQLINNQIYQEGYNRYAGVLGLDGFYIAVIAESWSFAGEYNDTTFEINVTNPYYNFTLPTDYYMMNITDRVEAFKVSFYFINDRDDGQAIQNLTLVSYFKADLYLNETGLASQRTTEKDLGSALNFSYDDTVKYNTTTQTLWVEDHNNNTDFASNDTETAMGFRSLTHPIKRYAIADAIGLITNITLYHLNASEWNTTDNSPTELSGEGKIDPGWASYYDIGTITPGTTKNFTGVLSLGQANSTELARAIMERQIHLISTNVTKYNITDLMVLSTNLSRMTERGKAYYTQAKIINIGNVPIEKSQLAFVVNRSNEKDVVEVTSTIFTVHTLNTFEIKTYVAKWVPLESGVYTTAWVFGELTDPIAMQEEANLLSNILGRTIFVINGTFYDSIKTERFLVFPTKLDQAPMEIYSPMDFAIFNLTVFSVWDIPNVTISTDGLGKKMVMILDPNLMKLNEQMQNLTSTLNTSLNENTDNTTSSTSTENTTESTDSETSSEQSLGLNVKTDNQMKMPEMNFTFQLPNTYSTTLQPYSQVLVIIFGNPLVPPGAIEFNITFTINGEEEPFYRIPVVFHMYPNRGRIWFDATHLNFFVSGNILGSQAFANLNPEDLNATEEQLTQNDTETQDLLGTFSNMSSFDVSPTDNFDLTRFIDLDERLDTTWGNYFKLREIWSEPESNNGKGAATLTVIPFISLNLTEMTGFDVASFRTSDIIPPTSFLGKTLGDYYFENNVFTTNWINHDILQLFDLVVLNDPEQALLPKEIQNITSWVENGGTLFVWSEDMYHTNVGSLNELLSNFDLQLANETFFEYSKYGYYTYNLTLNDKYSDLFAQGSTTIKSISFKDPIEVTSPGGSATILCGGAVGIAYYGKGRVLVIGDHDLFKESMLNLSDNTEFARQILRWGLENRYELNITATPTTLPLYEQGFVDVNITNFDYVQQHNLTSHGLLFISMFFFENGSMIQAQMYGFKMPLMPLFHTDGSHYMTYLDTQWYLAPGDYYVMILIDHPAAASEIVYVKFHVLDAPAPIPPERYQIPGPLYPHYIDIIAVLSITYMGLTLWYYDLEKYKKRLRITPLKGDFLNIARTRISEGKTLLKLLLKGLEKEDVEEIERIRYLLSNRKRLTRYIKELKRFGESIGEHY